jgi:hypothetical protein
MPSAGQAFVQRQRQLPADPEALPPTDANVCVFPTADQTAQLAAQLEGFHTVSIGCGEGFFEALLQRRRLTVSAVDLRSSAGDEASECERWAGSNCFCGEILRVRPHELYRLPQRGAGCALLFVFGKRCPLQRYLENFPDCRTVAIAGTVDGVTSPACDELSADASWAVTLDIPVRAVTAGARLIVYRREPPASAAEPSVRQTSPLRSRFWAGGGGSSNSESEQSSSSDTDTDEVSMRCSLRLPATILTACVVRSRSRSRSQNRSLLRDHRSSWLSTRRVTPVSPTSSPCSTRIAGSTESPSARRTRSGCGT